jgi:carotenoid cleavage dioxygenase
MTLTRRDFLANAAALGGGGLLCGGELVADEKSGEPAGNPFLEGAFAPVREEIFVEKLKVIGTLPREMDGMFVRNGPNPQFAPLANYHLFEGDGMLHGVRVRDGVASYRNRYVRTAAWREENKAGKVLWPSLLDERAAKDLAAQALAGRAPIKNTANTAVLAHHGKLLALWEAASPHEVKADSLETVGLYDFGGQWKNAFTAHPKVDGANGELVCFGYSPLSPMVEYGVFDRAGRLSHRTAIKLPRAVMMHDFAITQKHTLFFDLPAVIDLARGLVGKSMMVFAPEVGARVGVLGRRAAGDSIRWFEIKTCFIFHTLNAYDDGDEVVLLAVRYDHYPSAFDFSARPRGRLETPDWNDGRPAMYRWRFNLATGTVREEKLDDLHVEMPRVNDGLMAAKTRYGYAIGVADEMSSLVKFDLERGKRELHALGKGRLGGEGVFVPRAGAKTEDDGWIVSYVHDQATDKGEMVVVDARDFSGGPVARVMIPQRVPFGFHGAWVGA